MIRTLILEALRLAVEPSIPAAAASSLNLYFPKPSAGIHARSNTPLILASHHGGNPVILAQKIQERLMEGWRDQFTVTVTVRGTLAFRFSDSFIWNHGAESVLVELPKAIKQAQHACGGTTGLLVLPNELRDALQLTITHLEGAMMMLAEQPLRAIPECDTGSLPPPKHSDHRLTPLMSMLLVFPEYIAQESTRPQPQFAAAVHHLLQTFNSYRAAHPILGGKEDPLVLKVKLDSLCLLTGALRMVGKG